MKLQNKLNEVKFTKVHAKKAMKLLKGTSADNVIPKGDIIYVNYTSYKDRSKIAKAVGQLYKYDNDGRSTNAPRGILGLGGANWMSFVNESSFEKKLNKELGNIDGAFKVDTFDKKTAEFYGVKPGKYVKYYIEDESNSSILKAKKTAKSNGLKFVEDLDDMILFKESVNESINEANKYPTVSNKFKNALDILPEKYFNRKGVLALIKKLKEKDPEAAMAYTMDAFGWMKNMRENVKMTKQQLYKIVKEEYAKLKSEGYLKPISEARMKPVDEKMWKKMNDDRRLDALLSVVKDPDNAEKYIDTKWKELPSGFERDMVIYEKKKNKKDILLGEGLSSFDDLKKKAKKVKGYKDHGKFGCSIPYEYGNIMFEPIDKEHSAFNKERVRITWISPGKARSTSQVSQLEVGYKIVKRALQESVNEGKLKVGDKVSWKSSIGTNHPAGFKGGATKTVKITRITGNTAYYYDDTDGRTKDMPLSRMEKLAANESVNERFNIQKGVNYAHEFEIKDPGDKNLYKELSKNKVEFGTEHGNLLISFDTQKEKETAIGVLHKFGINESVNESATSDKLAIAIDKAIVKVDSSASYKDLAMAIAQILKNEYGSHNFKPFISALVGSLKEGKLNEGFSDINDPILIAVRARKIMLDKAKSAPKIKKINAKQYNKLMDREIDLIDQMKDAAREFEQLDSDMNAEAGQKGEDWSDADANRYGEELNKLQIKIKQLVWQRKVIQGDIIKYRMN